MDILFLCLIGGLVVAGGLWLASRDTMVTEVQDINSDGLPDNHQ